MRGIKAQNLEEICFKNKLSYTRFDYRGHGESEGDPAAFSLTDWLNDTLLILDNIHEPIVLVGSSMGGWLATLAAIRRPEKIRGLLLLASAPDFLQELVLPHLSKSDSWDLQQGMIVNLPSAYEQPYPLTQKLLDSGQELSVFKPVSLTDDTFIESKFGPEHLTCPIRLIHGTADADVPFELSIRLMNEFKRAEARLTLLSQADHRLSDERSLACIKHELMMLAIEVGNRE
jgi:pimeloyl-ACP methyl ester carboxylesterase